MLVARVAGPLLSIRFASRVATRKNPLLLSIVSPSTKKYSACCSKPRITFRRQPSQFEIAAQNAPNAVIGSSGQNARDKSPHTMCLRWNLLIEGEIMVIVFAKITHIGLIYSTSQFTASRGDIRMESLGQNMSPVASKIYVSSLL